MNPRQTAKNSAGIGDGLHQTRTSGCRALGAINLPKCFDSKNSQVRRDYHLRDSFADHCLHRTRIAEATKPDQGRPGCPFSRGVPGWSGRRGRFEAAASRAARACADRTAGPAGGRQTGLAYGGNVRGAVAGWCETHGRAAWCRSRWSTPASRRLASGRAWRRARPAAARAAPDGSG